MITIDLPISFLAGMGVAIAARDPGTGRIKNPDRAAAAGLAYQGLCLTPTILYFMTRFPDWEWNYFFAAGDFFFGMAAGAGGAVPPFWGAAGPFIFILLAAFTTASHMAGFALAARLIAHGRVRTARNTLAAVMVAVLITVAALADRALHVGTYHLYKSGNAPLFFDSGEFLVTLAVAGVVCGTPFIIVCCSLSFIRPP
jgi:hypothetical protein